EVRQERRHVHIGPDVGGRGAGHRVASDGGGVVEPVEWFDAELGEPAGGGAVGGGEALRELLEVAGGQLIGRALQHHVGTAAGGDNAQLAMVAERAGADGEV